MDGQPVMRRHHMHKKRKNLLNPKYSSFGKMGFPSATGNMMGLVQSSKGMPNFMKMPPTIHINADFRRLLGDNMKKRDEYSHIVMSKCVMVEDKHVCALFDLMDKSITLKLIVPDSVENELNGIVDAELQSIG